MSNKKIAVPDAWDDDWENLADTARAEPAPQLKPVALSSAERKAQHQEENRQIWEAAEAPATRPIFLQTHESVPLNTEWKPQMKVLSRKPQPKPTDHASGLSNLNLADDGSEDEKRKQAEKELADRQIRAQKEREEKQRRYAEVRERLFGPQGGNGDRIQAPITSTTNDNSNNNNSAATSSRNSSRNNRRNRIERNAAKDASPARTLAADRQLFDPNHSEKPASGNSKPERTAVVENQIVRSPRGPDGSGRGGIGFAGRGGLNSTNS